MRLPFSPLLVILLVAWAPVDAQTGASSIAVTTPRVATLEAEVIQLRSELARLRAPSGTGLPNWSEAFPSRSRPNDGAWLGRPFGPGEIPPLSPLQAQWAWVQAPFASLVAPFGAVGANCVPCPTCTDNAYTMRP